MKNYWVFVITGMLLIVTTTGFGRMALWRYIAVYAGGIESHNHSIWLLRNNAVLGYVLTVGLSGALQHTLVQKCSVSRGACAILGLIGLVFVANFWWAAITLFLAVLGVHPKKRGRSWDC